jgi:hypothetical protein
MSVFEKAAQQKLRFETKRGSITAEDLFDVPLEGEFSLDRLAQRLHAELKESGAKSFVAKRTKKDATIKLKLDIVKRVIEIALDARDAAIELANNKIHNEKILSALADVEGDELRGKSAKELRKMLK